MQSFDLYGDIAGRTQGDIYIGVVGPVRTGKSTFISKFMEALIIPNIENRDVRTRAIDALPQSADGKTIMTTEPKFVPDEAVLINFGNVNARVKMIDCVGYLVPSAIGHLEDGKPRFVATPWSDREIPFERAGEIGTGKVISEHSSVGVVITSDGTITDITRTDYVEAEERVVSELKEIGKPFVVVLNTAFPDKAETKQLTEELNKKYGVTVIAVDVKNMGKTECEAVLEALLNEFPVKTLDVFLPDWVNALDPGNVIIKSVSEKLSAASASVSVMKDYNVLKPVFDGDENIKEISDINVDMGTGSIALTLKTKDELFYKAVGDELGTEVNNDYQMLSYAKKLKNAYVQYGKLKQAMESVEKSGYGIVAPDQTELTLNEPEIYKQSGKYGVKLKASAPALHIMKIDVETEVCPIVGTEEQGKELLEYLSGQFENDKAGIWNTDIFGKSLLSLVTDGLNTKIYSVPEDVTGKMRKTMAKIVNEGKGGVICILL